MNNRRGASLLIALLLFLICMLAGGAALTASGANLGRYEYLYENQQRYLSVSSAARLFRDGLDGLEAEATFTATADKDYELHIKLIPEPDLPGNIYSVDNGVITLIDANSVEPGTVDIKPKPFSELIKEDLTAYVKNAFLHYYNDMLVKNYDLWAAADLNEAEYSLPLEFEHTFTVTGDEESDDEKKVIKDVTVTMKFFQKDTSNPEPEPAPKEFSTSNPIDVKITVGSEDTQYEMTGKLTADVKILNDPVTPVERSYRVQLEEKDKDGNPKIDDRTKSRSMLLNSTATVTVTLDLDEEISRVLKEPEVTP